MGQLCSCEESINYALVVSIQLPPGCWCRVQLSLSQIYFFPPFITNSTVSRVTSDLGTLHAVDGEDRIILTTGKGRRSPSPRDQVLR